MGACNFATRKLLSRYRAFVTPAAASILLMVALGQPAARATTYALLIGVSDYHNEKITKLKGPRNDVTLMWRILKKRGFSTEHMTILADGLPTGADYPKSIGDPTRARIMDSFAALGRSATAGDLVVIYYSGHGSEQPVHDLDQDPERDNLDQVMLPIDAGNYDPVSKSIRNGIVDDEIGKALDKIREHGADVWVIIDACHAGSMTRGTVDGDGIAVRGVDPQVLGVPPPAPVAASTRTDPRGWRVASRKSNAGSLVGFFAVDSSREAVERPFEEFDKPMIGNGPDRRDGVFTFFFYRALTDPTQFSTYRELAQQIVGKMQSSSLSPPALPSFDGDLDRPVLGIGRAPEPAAWQVKVEGGTVEVPAGALHGISENTVLKLAASPQTDAPELARATVTTADPARSVARLDAPLPSSAPQAIWARVAVPGISFALTVAEPPAKEVANDAVRRLIDEVKAQSTVLNKGAITWIAADGTAEVRLRAYGDRIWLLPADGEWVREDFQQQNPRLKRYPLSPSYLVTAPTSATDLANALHRIAKARNMVRLAEAADPEKGGEAFLKAVKVSAERLPSPGADRNPERDCPSLSKLSQHDLALAKEFNTRLPQPVFHCDLIRISVQNTGRRDVDVNLSYIGATSGITPLGAECQATVPPGGRLNRSFWVRTWDKQKHVPDSIGLEHVVITAVEQKDGIQSNLCFIQDAVRGIREGTRGTPEPRPGRAGWLLGALREAALAPSGTRGVEIAEEENAPDPAGAAMYLINLQVTPPDSP